MSLSRTADERISAWLDHEAPEQLPDVVLRTALDETRGIAQRRVLRWGDLLLRPGHLATAAAAVVAVLVGAMLLGTAKPPPFGAPTGAPSPTVGTTPSPTLVLGTEPVVLDGRIAFEWTVDGNTDIYVMNLDRTGLVRLTDDAAVDAGPSWSPDGTRIVLTRGSGEARDVFVIDADGTDVTRLTTTQEGEDGPAFSPNGAEIAFIRYVETDGPGYFDLYVMDAGGTNERLVWHKDDVWAAGPVWSPDGASIYLAEDETSGGQIDIVRIDVETGAMSRLTTSQHDDSSFDLSPDGSTIVFQSDRAPGGLFLMDADGSNVRHLTGTWDRGYPVSWAPSGRHLVYAHADGWLYVIAADGTGLTRWAQAGPGVAWQPTP